MAATMWTGTPELVTVAVDLETPALLWAATWARRRSTSASSSCVERGNGAAAGEAAAADLSAVMAAAGFCWEAEKGYDDDDVELVYFCARSGLFSDAIEIGGSAPVLREPR